ncbi:MAG: PQQ-binding-like beta-propeller repeat protein [Caldilineaceae bacterium]|nr:PQQ-binding-like beta-propeller repeat protein [Caldilineaceae bacterium]
MNANTLSPSPVVSSKSEVIVAHGSFVDVLRQGALFQRLTLDAAAYGVPAVAADGTIYALDVNGKLYAFMPQKSNIDDYLFNSDNRYRRWALALGAAPTTSPVIGPNGFVAVGANGLHLIRPDGFKFKSHSVNGQIVGAVAWDGDQALYIATTNGYFGKLNFFCPDNALCQTNHSVGVTPAYTTPPLVAYGSAFAGRSDGKLIKFMTNQSFQADSAITAGPVAGPAGQILIGTQNGTIYSLKQDLTVRWQRNIGEAVRSIPAFSADALYIVSGNRLRAYDPFGGAPLWDRVLGGDIGYGSVAVGYGRELYMQTSSGKVLAYGEGWQPAPILVEAKPVALGNGRQLIRLEVTLAISNVTSAADTVQGLLIQRSVDDGEWRDLTILPPGATVFSDTNVMTDVEYGYRAQVLDANGNDSEFTETGQSAQSLPALPQAPVLKSVTPDSADSLRLTWDAPVDVVDFYLIERGDNQAGPFEQVGKVSGEATTSVDSGGLTPGATYHYRLIPLNESGEGPASNVVAGTTKQRTLPAPQNLAAKLVDGDMIEVTWTGAPDGVTAVVELTVFGFEGYEPLGNIPSAGPFVHFASDLTAYDYRVKFVQGNNESEYSYTQQSVLVGEQVEANLYLPMVQR